MKDHVMIDVLIENITTDLNLLEEVEVKLKPLEVEKREISARIKEHQKDASVLIKYADDKHREQLESLGFYIPPSITGLNEVAALALEIVGMSKEKKLTNDALYKQYVQTAKQKEQEPVGYAEFNIKCRSLFNTQRLVRTKGKDPKSSRDDIIWANVSSAVKS